MKRSPAITASRRLGSGPTAWDSLPWPRPVDGPGCSLRGRARVAGEPAPDARRGHGRGARASTNARGARETGVRERCRPPGRRRTAETPLTVVASSEADGNRFEVRDLRGQRRVARTPGVTKNPPRARPPLGAVAGDHTRRLAGGLHQPEHPPGLLRGLRRLRRLARRPAAGGRHPFKRPTSASAASGRWDSYCASGRTSSCLAGAGDDPGDPPVPELRRRERRRRARRGRAGPPTWRRRPPPGPGLPPPAPTSRAGCTPGQAEPQTSRAAPSPVPRTGRPCRGGAVGRARGGRARPAARHSSSLVSASWATMTRAADPAQGRQLRPENALPAAVGRVKRQADGARAGRAHRGRLATARIGPVAPQ